MKKYSILFTVISIILALTSCETYLDDYDGILNRDVSFICVNAAASGKQNGNGWVDAYTTLAAAVSNARSGDEIWICGDLSQENTQIIIDKDLTIIGGFDDDDNLESEKDPDNKSVVSWAVNDNMFLIPNPCNITFKSLDLNNTNTSNRTIAITDGSLSIRNCIFDNNDSDLTGMQGGAIYGSATVKNVSIDNCTFQNCDSRYSGAIYLNCNASIRNCTFTECTSETYAGAIRASGVANIMISDCRFQNCNSEISGGAISLGDVTGEINNCIFENNSSPFGGAVSIDNSNVNVKESSFTENIINPGSEDGGGAIYGSSSTIHIYSSSFIKNRHLSNSNAGGGGIWIENNSYLYVYNSSFKENMAYTYGGAIMVYNTTGELYLKNCSFEDNTAAISGNSGNSIYLLADIMTIEECSFIGSTFSDQVRLP